MIYSVHSANHGPDYSLLGAKETIQSQLLCIVPTWKKFLNIIEIDTKFSFMLWMARNMTSSRKA